MLYICDCVHFLSPSISNVDRLQRHTAHLTWVIPSLSYTLLCDYCTLCVFCPSMFAFLSSKVPYILFPSSPSLPSFRQDRSSPTAFQPATACAIPSPQTKCPPTAAGRLGPARHDDPQHSLPPPANTSTSPHPEGGATCWHRAAASSRLSTATAAEVHSSRHFCRQRNEKHHEPESTD